MTDGTPIITTQPVKTEQLEDHEDEVERERAKKNETFWQRFRVTFSHCFENITDCLDFWCCKNECYNFCCNSNDIDDDEDVGEVAFNSDGGEQAMLTVINRRGSHDGATENKGLENDRSDQAEGKNTLDQSGSQSSLKVEDHKHTEDHSAGRHDHLTGHDHSAGHHNHPVGHDHSAGHHDQPVGHDHSAGHHDHSTGNHDHSGGHNDGGYSAADNFSGGDCGGGDSGGGSCD